MKKHPKRLTLNRETLRLLSGETLQGVVGGIETLHCPCTQSCDSCDPCTLGPSCVSGNLDCS